MLAPARGDARDNDALEALVVAEQVKGLYAKAPLPLVTVVVNASVLAYVVGGQAAARSVEAWLGSLYVITALRVVLWQAYRRASPLPAEARKWGWRFALGSAANGAAWGASAFALYPPGGVVLQALILLVLGGMSAGAAASTATFFPAFLAFVVPALAPTAVRLLAEGDRVHVAMGGMAGIFMLAMAQIARAGGRSLVASYTLRFRNAALAGDLGEARERLTAYSEQLERRVAERTSELVAALEQRTRTEEALRLQKEVLQKVFDHSPLMLVLFGPDGRVELVNRELELDLGWSADALRARDATFDAIASPLDRHSFPEHLARGESTWREFKCAAKDGRLLDTSWASVRLSDGTVIGIGQDVTEQRKVRQALAVSERMSSVGTLAAGVAHEINNPLAFVLSNLEFTREKLRKWLDRPAGTGIEDADPALRQVVDALADAYAGAERVRNIVRDLNTFSRGTDDDSEPVDLVAVLEASIRLAQNELRHRASIVREFGPVVRAVGHAGKLGQVFLNLLVNAAQAIPEGDASNNQVTVAARTDDQGRAVVEVRDTGVGIPREIMPRILDPFFTTKRVGQGTGLGLSICHGIVKGLAGELEFESEVGRGSVFRVILPAAPVGAPPAVSEEAPPRQAGRARLLLIDDEPMFGRAIERMLDPGQSVVFETSARAALARIAAGEAFDVIVCDLMMPDFTGMDFFDTISKAYPHLVRRVVFTTGGAFTGPAREFFERVPNPRLGKPFTKRELQDTLAATLGTRRSQPR